MESGTPSDGAADLGGSAGVNVKKRGLCVTAAKNRAICNVNAREREREREAGGLTGLREHHIVSGPYHIT